MKMSEKIRQSLIDLNPYANNREIAQHCQTRYGFKPSSQQIYEAIGSEVARKAEQYNGRQLLDVKKLCRKAFAGDFNRLLGAVRLVASNINAH